MLHEYTLTLTDTTEYTLSLSPSSSEYTEDVGYESAGTYLTDETGAYLLEGNNYLMEG